MPPDKRAPAERRWTPPQLGQAHVTGAGEEIVTVEPGFEVLLVAAAAVTISTGETVSVTDGFTLPAGVPVTFKVPSHGEALTFRAASAMTSAVSFILSETLED